jgi:hypothetical protein
MKNPLRGIIMLLMAFAGPGIAGAQEVLLDDVETSIEPEWAEIRVHFTVPINYVSHFPREHGQLLKVFLNVVAMDLQDISLRQETRHVSATPVLPAATITFDPPLSLNLQRDPWSLTVRFNRDVNYNVRPGDDNRSILIYLPIVPVETGPANAPRNAPATKDRSAK